MPRLRGRNKGRKRSVKRGKKLTRRKLMKPGESKKGRNRSKLLRKENRNFSQIVHHLPSQVIKEETRASRKQEVVSYPTRQVMETRKLTSLNFKRSLTTIIKKNQYLWHLQK